MTSAKDPLAEVWNHSGPVRPDVLTTYDPVTRTALLILPACNITVAFTAADVSLDQPLAQLSVEVSCANCTILNTGCSASVLCAPEGRPGMSDVTLLPGISGLSFDSCFLSDLLLSSA